MTTKAERKAAAREAKREMSDVKRDMTPAERKDFRATEKKMKRDQMSRLDRKIRVISPERRKEREEKQKERRRARQFEAPSGEERKKGKEESARKIAQDLRRERKLAERASRSGIGDPVPPEWQEGDFWPEEQTNLMVASAGEASGGQVKKYGYMGGGKVYDQPRKANYKAG